MTHDERHHSVNNHSRNTMHIGTDRIPVTGATGQQGGCQLPVVYSVASGFGGVLDPETPPPGANRECS